MLHSDNELLNHIFDEILYLEQQVEKVDLNAFLEDDTRKRAFARSIEIIGEAVKNLSNQLIVQNTHIPWRNIAGMRDKLIHGYFSVDYNLIWDVAKNIIPEFKEQLEKIL